MAGESGGGRRRLVFCGGVVFVNLKQRKQRERERFNNEKRENVGDFLGKLEKSFLKKEII